MPNAVKEIKSTLTLSHRSRMRNTHCIFANTSELIIIHYDYYRKPYSLNFFNIFWLSEQKHKSQLKSLIYGHILGRDGNKKVANISF